MEINTIEVGNRIKHIRLSLGLTQEGFGDIVGETPKSTISTWENGKNLPNRERLKKIAEIGVISVNYLLYGLEDEVSLGEKIKDRRKELDLSKKDLGKQIGSDKDTIKQYENDELEPSIEDLDALSKILNVDPSYLTSTTDMENADVVSLLREMNLKLDTILNKLQ